MPHPIARRRAAPPLAFPLLFAALVAVPALAPSGARGQASPMDFEAAPRLEYEGAVATGLALRQLGNTARLLHIGAHPDDENTALFAPLALGRGADAAYLSLTRGEGGQNGIGPELSTALGIIRSEELLAARALDGAAQFFTRAIDYGYSKSAEEAFRHWPRDSLLADVVAVIRRYRPDVVVSVWSGTTRDGHGQHEASGIIAREAVLAAGDPMRFPEQIAAGLRPHTPARYFWSARYGEDGPDVELNTGQLDPLLGRSYHQIAMASRSRHRSQDMGQAEEPGPRRTSFDAIDPADPPEVAARSGYGRTVEGAPADDRSLFAGVDTLLSQRAADLVADRAFATRIAANLREYETLVERAREDFDALAPWRIVPALADAHRQLESIADAVADRAALVDLRYHIAAELEDLRRAVLAASNVELDVVADEERVVPGQTFRLELGVWNGGPEPVTAELEPLLPAGWSARAVDGDTRVVIAPGARATAAWAVTVPDDAPPTLPYYLDVGDPAEGEDLYDWPSDYDLRGLPFAPAPVRAAFRLAPGQTAEPIRVEREAVHVDVDPRSGELRRPVRVVPAIAVGLDPRTVVIPLGSGPTDPLEFTVRLRGEAPGGIRGELRPILPSGWRATPERVAVALEEGEERTVRLDVVPAAAIDPGAYRVGAEVRAHGRAYDVGYEIIDYPHIDPHHLYRPAESLVRALDVRVADVRVGYVAGIADGVPEALDQLDVAWEPLDAQALAAADLSRFDVIITGTRAYEVRPDLVAHNRRLLDWTRRGGTLIVQYNKYGALDGDYAPWPVTIDRPHGRVTDETAPVEVLEPRHPIFNGPNEIGPADWQGWVQERGLYFWESWDGPLRPLLAMSDPGEQPLTGALLVAPLGQGTYVYSALALFRQLPEGVPGAYRLLANLVSLGAGNGATAP